MSTPTILYIAGYGRSGSTLLDVTLGNDRNASSLGELGSLWASDNPALVECSCGLQASRCPFWQPVLEALDGTTDAPAIASSIGSVERILPSGQLLPARRTTYRKVQRSAFATLRDQTGTSLLVDSSKTAYRFAWRPLALSILGGFRVIEIHLIRDPRDVLASALKGRNSELAKGAGRPRAFETFITLVGWNIANLIAILNGLVIGKQHYVRVDFSDFVRDPVAVVQRIASRFELDLGDLMTKLARNRDLQVGHLIGGNRMARVGTISISRKPDPDTPLPTRSQRWLLALLGSWIYRALR